MKTINMERIKFLEELAGRCDPNFLAPKNDDKIFIILLTFTIISSVVILALSMT